MKRVETLRELQLIELEILKDFVNFCEEKNVHYALDAGALIGAIRHKGFIPWDDDIDICLSRPEYEKIVDYTKKTNGKISDRCSFVNPEAYDDYNGYIPLIVYDNSKLISRQYRRNEELKISISLFVYDGIPEDKNMQKLFFGKMYVFRAFHALCRADFNYVNTKMAVPIGKVLSPFFGMRTLKYFKKKILNLQKQYSYENAKNISANTDIHPERLIENKADFEKQVIVEFENMKITTYSDFDRHMRSYYGDYMKPPPLEERTAKHGFEAWYE